MDQRTWTDEAGSLGGAPQRPRELADGPALGPGACVGRYTIRAHVGSGGMGDVFAAHDPELDRDVALKVLRAELAGRSPESRARLQREAQALARLNHPNVVAVHDVGLVDDRVFVTMELVEGPTLADWLAEQPRTWREVVAVFLAAGQGLQAAHAAGLVHRDFKSSNVMLGDRVRVVDFGLARPADDVSTGPTTPSASTMLDGAITRTGHAIGTPAYMAPEQRRGESTTALSDQYSFGVALHEALLGWRPHEPPLEGPPRAVPAHLRALVERALRDRPEERFPSMRELLVELARDPGRTRRRWAIGIAGAITAAGLVFAIARANSDVGPSCDISDDRFAGVWDPPRREAVHAAFVASKQPYAEAAWNAARAQVDGYVGAWLDMQRETCRATRIVGQQSDALMDLRTECLERRRTALEALLAVWTAGVDAKALETAGDAVGRLDPINDCANTRTLTERVPLPADPAKVASIATVRAYIDRAAALVIAGRYKDALATSRTARGLADAAGWPPGRAEALVAEASALKSLADPAAATSFIAGLREANLARDDRLVARALVELVGHYAFTEQSASRALTVAEIADGVVARAGDDARMRVHLLRYRGDALLTAGDYAAAAPAFQAARERAATAFGADDTETIAVVIGQTRLAKARGDLAEVRKLSEVSLRATTARLGANHPNVVPILNALADAAQMMGDYDAAVDYWQHVIPIVEANFGANTASMATLLANLGAMELQRDHLARAETLLERSLAIREKTLPPDHPNLALPLGNLALVRNRQGRTADALALLERALAIKLKAYGPAHASVAFTYEAMGTTYARARRQADVLDAQQHAFQIREKALGPDHPLTRHSMLLVAEAMVHLHRCREAKPLLNAATKDPSKLEKTALAAAAANRAECELARGNARGAIAALEPMLAELDKQATATLGRGQSLSNERGEMRWMLARAFRGAGRTREAIATAELAARELDASAPQQPEVRALLATHR